MEQKEILEKVMKIVNDMPGFEECTSDMDFVDEIGFSSLEIMDIMVQVEDMFEIQITPAEMRMIFTPEDLAELIEAKQ